MTEVVSFKDLWDLVQRSPAKVLKGIRFYASSLKPIGYLSVAGEQAIFGVYGLNNLLEVLAKYYPNYKIAGFESYAVDSVKNIEKVVEELDRKYEAIVITSEVRKQEGRVMVELYDVILKRKNGWEQ